MHISGYPCPVSKRTTCWAPCPGQEKKRACRSRSPATGTPSSWPGPTPRCCTPGGHYGHPAGGSDLPDADLRAHPRSNDRPEGPDGRRASDNIPGIRGGENRPQAARPVRFPEAVLSRGALEPKAKLKERLTTYADQTVFSPGSQPSIGTPPFPSTRRLCLGELTDGIPTLERYKLRALIARLGVCPRNLPQKVPPEQRGGPAPHPLADAAEIEGMEALNAWAAKLPSGRRPGAGPLQLRHPKGSRSKSAGGDLLSPGIQEPTSSPPLPATSPGRA